MDSGLGVVGVFVLAFGGVILFEALYSLLEVYSGRCGRTSIGLSPFDVLGFIGFLFVGFGLLLIVQSGKPEMKEKVQVSQSRSIIKTARPKIPNRERRSRRRAQAMPYKRL